MGNWRNIVKRHDNEETVDRLLKMMDKTLEQLILDSMRINGISLNELDPEEMACINKYIANYKTLKKMMIEEAKKQDDKEFGNELYKRRIEEKLDKLLEKR